MPHHSPPPAGVQPAANFATTRWSMVVAAGGESSEQSKTALADLCKAYWYPLYVFARRRGNAAGEAQDLVQGFFAYLLEKGTLAAADEERGRFRTFLLTVFQRFCSHERERANAKKRGGGKSIVGFEAGTAEERYQREPFHELTPERIYDRRYALTLLETVFARLESDYRDKGRDDLFERLKGTLTGAATETYAQIADDLGLTESAVKIAAHRLRQQYKEVLRSEIAQTVNSSEEIDDELRRLMESLAGT